MVFEGRIEDLLDLGVQSVDLVHEENLAVVEGGQEGGQVAGALDDRPRRGFDGDLQLGRDHMGQARLPHPGRAEEEDVVEGFATGLRGLDGDPQVLDHVGLADVIVESPGTKGKVEAGVVLAGAAGDDSGVGHVLELTAPRGCAGSVEGGLRNDRRHRP